MNLLAVFLLVLAGVAAGVAVRVNALGLFAAGVSAVILATALLRTRVIGTIIELGMWLLLAGLVVWSYGFNNIGIPIGDSRMPVVEPLVLCLVVATWRDWAPFVARPVGRGVFVALLAITAVALPRLVVDVPVHGVLAIRDALWVIDLWAILLGFALVRRAGSRFLPCLSAILGVAVLWHFLFPFAEEVGRVGPLVGLQHETPLFHVEGGINRAAVIGLFWFLFRPGRPSYLFATLSATLLLIGQARGAYLAVLLGLMLVAVLAPWTNAVGRSVRGRMRALLPVAIAGLALLAVVPFSEGRVTDLGPGTVAAQLQTLAGGDGPGAGSVSERQRWWTEVWGDSWADSSSLIAGRGFGLDLLDRRALTDEINLRTPHNDPLELLARGGVLLLGPFLALLFLLVRPVVSSLRKTGQPIYAWGLGIQCFFLITMLTQPVLQFAYSVGVYAMLSGIVLAFVDDKESEPYDSEISVQPRTGPTPLRDSRG